MTNPIPIKKAHFRNCRRRLFREHLLQERGNYFNYNFICQNFNGPLPLFIGFKDSDFI